MLKSGNLAAQAADEIHVLGNMVVDVQGVAGGVRLYVLSAVGVLERVEGFVEGRSGAAGLGSGNVGGVEK